MSTAVYARVSLEEQADKFGLRSQLRACVDHAANKERLVSEEFTIVDAGYSGEDLDRPGLEKLRSLVKARRVNLVIVHDPDRLCRKLAHMAILQEEFERHGARVDFVTTPAAEDAEGRMFLNLKGVFAEYEREKIRERTLRGRREKARQGYVVGGRVPFGYQYRGKAASERGRLVIDDGEAETVRTIFQWADEGASIREIASRLNALGIKPKLATRWGKSSVFRVLTNESYIGQAYYNRRRRARPEQIAEVHRFRRNKKTVLRMRPEAEWIALAAPPIVERQLFDRVRLRLKQNFERLSGRPSNNYMLRGLCWCGHCGRRLQGCPSHGRRFYRCSGRDRLAVPKCDASIVHGEKLEAAVWRAVAEAFENPHALREVIARNAKHFSGPDDGESQDAALTARIAKAERKIAQLVRCLADSDLIDHFAQFKGELAQVKNEHQRLQVELSTRQRRQAAAKTALPGVDVLCRSIRRAIARADDATRIGFIQRLVERVTVKDRTAEILCSVPVLGGYRSELAHDRPSWLRQNDARQAVRGHPSSADLPGIHRDDANP